MTFFRCMECSSQARMLRVAQEVDHGLQTLAPDVGSGKDTFALEEHHRPGDRCLDVVTTSESELPKPPEKTRSLGILVFQVLLYFIHS